MQVIVYEQDNGSVAVVYSVNLDLDIDQIAEKVVPPIVDGEVTHTRPYWVVDSDNLPPQEMRDSWILINGQVLVNPESPTTTLPPDPKGFYNKAIGMNGTEYPLYLVFSSLQRHMIDNTQDTSSLVGALLVYNNTLNINDWSLPKAKDAYKTAYDQLKQFLTVGQIDIVDKENVNFRLV